MWHDLFAEQLPAAEKVIRTVAVYALLVVLFRLTGKRGLASMNTFDIIVISLLSNVVQNAIIGPDDSLWGGLFGAIVLIAVNGAVNRVTRSSPTAVKVFEGTPTVLVHDGHVDERNVTRLGLRQADVMNALRQQGASSLDEVAEADLKPGGTIVVELRPGAENATKADIARVEAKLDALLSPGAG
jgi:uncharacterized membrane protein YcaP (DUF421 family)